MLGLMAPRPAVNDADYLQRWSWKVKRTIFIAAIAPPDLSQLTAVAPFIQ